ncbi:serine protease, partial [Streptococcus suis]|nr:serine protease [Streptococcus suis]
ILAVSLALAAAVPYIPLLGDEKLPSLPKIVGGEDATPGEFPYQVSIQKQGLFGRCHICGASVLNEHHVLTAVHCLKGANANSLYVVLGEYDLSKTSGDEQVIIAGELVIHEHYDGTTFTNDVGIIRLVPSITFNEKVGTVTLPAQGELVDAGTECVATGWGASVEGGSVENVLKKVTVPVVSDADCRASYGVTDIGDHMLCAG